MTKKLLAALLAFAMLFALIGCNKKAPSAAPTAETAAPTEPAVPGAEQFKQMYEEAAAKLTSADAVTFDVALTEVLTIEDQKFEAEKKQIISYSGLNSDNVIIRMEEDVKYSEDKDAEEDATTAYYETYSNGTLYVELKDTATFTGELSKEEAALRYVPVTLLDTGLYGEITMEAAGEEKTISFAAPTAAESWAIPADATMETASGTAQINADGTIKSMAYTVSYKYGTAQFSRTVTTTPKAEVIEAKLPEKAEDYTKLQYPLALYTVLESENLLESTETATTNKSETYISYAGAVEYFKGRTMYIHGSGDDLIAKFDSNVQIYSSQGEESTKQEEVYQDGKFTIKVDDGVPTVQSGVKPKDIREAALTELTTSVAPPAYWQDVTVTEMSGLQLLEFTYTEDFANNMQNSVCMALFQDPSLLNSFATKYENKEITGYLSVEGYTGLPVSSGMYFEGEHTIEKEEYLLSLQCDQSYQIPSYSAYHEITDKYLEDAEPENKAKPLFYKVTGADGQQMWLLGTIHVGDNRTAYLPKEITDALEGSDALALEIDADSAEDRLETDTKLQKALSKAYYYSDGSTTDKHLDEELYKKGIQFMKATGNYSTYTQYMKIGTWAESADSSLVALGHKLLNAQGVEERLTRIAKEKEIPIREVEDFAKHAGLYTSWSKELQILLLEEGMEADLMEYTDSVQELYEAWCTGDEAALIALINEADDTSEFTAEELAEYEAAKPLMAEYEKAMMYDRNETMLKVAKKYLESGDVVFYAVGLAHLLDETNGLVEGLRAAGYTVEIVAYQ